MTVSWADMVLNSNFMSASVGNGDYCVTSV